MPPLLRTCIRWPLLLVLGLIGAVPRDAHALPWSGAGSVSDNVTVLGHYPMSSSCGLWDVATWTDPGGHEYAIVGADSLHIVDLADPAHPRAAVVIPSPNLFSLSCHFADVVVTGHYAIAGLRKGPILVVDLSGLPATAPVVAEIPAVELCGCSEATTVCVSPARPRCSGCTATALCQAGLCPESNCCQHLKPDRGQVESLWIDDDERLYVAGLEAGQGTHIYDVSDPLHPLWRCHEHTFDPTEPLPREFFTREIFTQDDTLYISRSRSDRFLILRANGVCPAGANGDCGSSSASLLRAFGHDGPIHAHTMWRLRNPRYLLTCDEVETGHVRVWDQERLLEGWPESAAEVGHFWPDSTRHSVHTVYAEDDPILGSVCYSAYYNKGIQIFRVYADGTTQRLGYLEHPTRWRGRETDTPCFPLPPARPTGEDLARSCTNLAASDQHCFGVPFLTPFGLSNAKFVAVEVGSITQVGGQEITSGGLLVCRYDRPAVDVATSLDGSTEAAGVRTASAAPGLVVLGAGAGREVRVAWVDCGARASDPAPGLDVYDSAGAWVARLEPEDPGKSTLARARYVWETTDARGRAVPAGVYFVRAPARFGASRPSKVVVVP